MTNVVPLFGFCNVGQSHITLAQHYQQSMVGSRLISTQALLLGKLAELALVDPREALRQLHTILPTNVIHDSLLFLRLAVFDQAALSLAAPKVTEFHVHKQFFANLDEYLPGAVRLEKKSDPLHMPDGWVDIHGETLPVEMKRDAFTKASARQLVRYIEHYGLARGVAVAASFTCAPDPRFICITHNVNSSGDSSLGGPA